jgi:SAM-dependent methyltransferase
MEKYQDYVIKDGRLIGNFEEMYQKIENPWYQESDENNLNSYSRMITILNIRRYKIRSLVEFGCGLGYYTNLISSLTGIQVLGVDMASTAIKKAKEKWPLLSFVTDKVQNIHNYTKFEAILFADITWYILEDLDAMFDSMLKNFYGKYFLHNLVFYKGQQQYGREYFTNLKEFIEFIPFTLIGYSESTTVESDVYETSSIFKIEKK